MRPRIGNVLPNGAIVLEINDHVILAKNHCGTRDEYVTWRWDGKDPASTSWGKYHESLSKAAISFEVRTEDVKSLARVAREEEHEADRISDKWRTR